MQFNRGIIKQLKIRKIYKMYAICKKPCTRNSFDRVSGGQPTDCCSSYERKARKELAKEKQG